MYSVFRTIAGAADELSFSAGDRITNINMVDESMHFLLIRAYNILFTPYTSFIYCKTF